MEEAVNELSFLVTGTYGHPAPPQHGADGGRREILTFSEGYSYNRNA